MTQQPQPEWQPTNPPVPAVQRSWFARNKALSVLLGIVLVVIVCCGGFAVLAAGGADTASDTTSDTTSVDSSSSEDAASPAKEEEPKEKTSTADEPQKDSAPGIGSPARDGKFEFTVTKVEEGVEQVGSEFFSESADGQFVLVHITVKNIGDESQTLFDSEQKLKDGQGRSFSTDSGAAIAMEDNDVWLNEINPGNTASGTLVYDMPADAQPAEIELHDSMFSGGVTVSLK
ncbi:DUF4352 domain-containing protein [Janibacter anophelis]|uniref:DUF4352 domain-containing protein n=1 Tax=Janibacter anophelis TaxID=319054 RepID=UPI00083346A6|nr:DUF4352 domain-containing protein [Janibacter anophelis]